MDHEKLKFEILKSFDFAFNINWEDPHHKKIHAFLTSLTMHYCTKMNGHISGSGAFLAYRFDDRFNIDEKIEVFRKLFKNESRQTFNEELVGGCHIFKI